jgi:hypothetical protein
MYFLELNYWLDIQLNVFYLKPVFSLSTSSKGRKICQDLAMVVALVMEPTGVQKAVQHLSRAVVIMEMRVTMTQEVQAIQAQAAVTGQVQGQSACP